MKKRYIGIIGALALSVMLTACSGGSVSSVDSSQNSDSAEVTSNTQTPQQKTGSDIPPQEDAPGASTSEDSAAARHEAPTAESDEEILGTLTMELPGDSGGYSADWLYGTWSALTLNGSDYWEFANAQGIDGEVQMIFGSDGGKVTKGSDGVVVEFTFKVTDSGVAITDKESGD